MVRRRDKRRRVTCIGVNGIERFCKVDTSIFCDLKWWVERENTLGGVKGVTVGEIVEGSRPR